MSIEEIKESILPIDELFDLYCQAGNDRIQGYKLSSSKLDEKMRKFSVDELNIMKKHVLNNYNMRRASGIGFLKYILGFLKKTISYTNNYRDMRDYFKEYSSSTLSWDPKFEDMLDKLSIPELYLALYESPSSSFYEYIINKIKEKEKKEEEKQENEKEERSKELKDRLVLSLNNSPEEVIMMLLDRLDKQEKILEEVLRLIITKNSKIEEQLYNIEREVGKISRKV